MAKQICDSPAARRAEVYAFKINKNDSNPATAVTPFVSKWGCDNVNYTPAHMDFTRNVFDYGSWKGTEFFFPKPCVLGYDGKVISYLNPDDYTKTTAGATANITSPNGNVMVEFPTVWINSWEDGDYAYVVISNEKLDENFHAYAHHDKYGNVLSKIYFSAYDGSMDTGGKLRSISGIAANNTGAKTTGKLCTYYTRQEEIDAAIANNIATETGEGWYTWHLAEVNMIRMLLLLLGMNLDTQTTFGRGRDTGYVSTTNVGMVSTGSMNTKGLFWGENAGAAGVKVFGIENFWANMWKGVAGWINNNGVQKVKLTYGTEDGSSGEGFNTTGAGYHTMSGVTPSGTSGGYINDWKMTGFGLIPYVASGSSSTYLCDGFWFNNGQVDYAVVGGGSADGLYCGAFYSSLYYAAAIASWYLGSSPVYKSLANQ